jgi:hypothetical protein
MVVAVKDDWRAAIGKGHPALHLRFDRPQAVRSQIEIANHRHYLVVGEEIRMRVMAEARQDWFFSRGLTSNLGPLIDDQGREARPL